MQAKEEMVVTSVDGESSRESSVSVILIERVNAIVEATHQTNGNGMAVGVREGAISDIGNSSTALRSLIVESPNCTN